MTIRIVLAIPELDSGGPDRVIYELLTGLDRSRFDPVLVVSDAGGRYFDRLKDTLDVRVIGGGRYPFRRFAQCMDAVRPDIVFTTLRMNITAVLARMVQRHRPLIIARQANAIAADFAVLRRNSLIKHRLAEVIIGRLLGIPEALVAQSEDMAGEIRPKLTTHQQLAVIGNPASLSEIEAEAEQQRTLADFAPLPGKPAIVAAGRLAPQKGFDLLLPAFARFLQQYPDAVLTIRGEGEMREALEQSAKYLGIEGSVRLPGHGSAALAEIASADLFISSSRYEGFSNAMLEAMALRVPVVATDCPGATRDLVRDGETGMLAPSIDADSIFGAMARVMKVDRGMLAAKAREHVDTSYDKAAIISEYEKLFEKLVAGRG